ncbi:MULTISPECIES: helix-turn-helix transcriptional regulator [unclassified Lacticaseibacillus]|uniref:helix-turn-helix domain-containing protein n=1 Tax=unclassified Lacticaseibacillus TaxID=2759744 RepID=UPI001944AE9D|nr:MULTISPECIES: helix-turn-helix transcriptional regulator [unclassified Lacticaseibacillus]
MAGRIGPFIRQLRLTHHLTQHTLYEGLLSERQAVRFEAGDNDIQAERLFTIMSRLALPLAELQPFVPTPAQPPVLKAALAKRAQWADWPLTTAETDAISEYVTGKTPLTLSEIQELSTLLGHFDPALATSLYENVWRHLQDHQSRQEFNTVASSFCIGALYYALFHADTTMAHTYLSRLTRIAPTDLIEQIQLRFLTALVSAVPQGEGAAYQKTDDLIAGLRAIGAPAMADALIDNRRHVLTAFGKHAQWTPAELGALARSQEKLPEDLRQNDYPGLAKALQHRSLADYRSIY